METSKSLYELAEVVDGDVLGNPQIAVSDVTHDSRQAGPGALFIAIEGEVHDGHDFAPEAISTGASALCVQRKLEFDVPQLIVANTRRVAGQLASEVHGNPSHELDVIGVTGTNGKTTVTHFVESLLSAHGTPTGLIGTIGSRALGKPIQSIRTTPEATDFQRLLGRMRDVGTEKVAVEVSSHALELDRVRGTRFAVAAFTNLSQDHLDFHGTMEAYRTAKERLFSEYEVGMAVLNVDDPVGSAIAEGYSGSKVTVGNAGEFGGGEIVPTSVGVEFELRAPGFRERVAAPVFGSFNVSNLLLAMACCYVSDMTMSEIVAALSELPAVPGRFEIVSHSDEPTVVVDYAHTPDGVEMAVATARPMASGRLLVVIGAGGDRDSAKRAPMGAAASGGDLVFVTSDNPRSEDPGAIVDQVLQGVTTDYIREPDRAAAIGTAISTAGIGDVVLILGKGHEKGQEIAGEVFPFDDREVARHHLNLLRKSANSGPDSGSMLP